MQHDSAPQVMRLKLQRLKAGFGNLTSEDLCTSQFIFFLQFIEGSLRAVASFDLPKSYFSPGGDSIYSYLFVPLPESCCFGLSVVSNPFFRETYKHVYQEL